MQAVTKKHLDSTWIIASFLSLGAFLLLMLVTRWGISISPDSISYITNARKFGATFNPMVLEAHWPPGYPLLLWLASLFGHDILITTKVLHAIIFGASTFFFVLLTAQITGDKSRLILPGTLIFIFSYPIFYTQVFAWSENPFILLQMAGLYCLLRHWETKKNSYLYYSALLAGFSVLMRYAGIAFVAAVPLTLLVLKEPVFKDRFLKSLKYGLVAIAPITLWLVCSALLRQETTNRELIVLLVSLDALGSIRDRFLELLGYGVNIWIFLLCSLSLIACLFFFVRQGSRNAGTYYSSVTIPAFLVLLIYVLVYTLFIIFAKSFLDAYIPLDQRIFFPTSTFLVLLMSCMIALLLRQPLAPRVAAVFMLAGALALNGLITFPLMATINKRGAGMMDAVMASLPDLGKVPALQDKVIYSNAADYLRLKWNFDARFYPYKYNTSTYVSNPEYDNEMSQMWQETESGKAILVHFVNYQWRAYQPRIEELEARGFRATMGSPLVLVFDAPHRE